MEINTEGLEQVYESRFMFPGVVGNLYVYKGDTYCGKYSATFEVNGQSQLYEGLVMGPNENFVVSTIHSTVKYLFEEYKKEILG